MNLAPLKTLVDTALGFIYPNVCQVCEAHRATAAEGFVCPECRENVRFIQRPFCEHCGLPYSGELTAAFECTNCKEMELYFRSARSAVIFKGLVHEVILRYKYKRELWFEAFLADLLIREALPELRAEKWDWIVPVPLHPAKRRLREFNQAERLGALLSKAAGIPVNTKLLKRVSATETQTKLSREDREKNIRNAFAMRNNHKLNGERILLFDDVFTTGATTNACAKVLRKAGAGEICVWTVARGL